MRTEAPSKIITAETAEAYRVLPGAADLGLIILCDHAENRFPDEYGTLGLEPAQLRRHIAYDIGAAAITERLSRSLGVPAVLSRFSRLLIDPNRGADDPTLIMRLSDGAVIPGNKHLDDAERGKRIERHYLPYHQAIDRVLDKCIATGTVPAILSLHSFTESWKGAPRPWHVGILWDKDPRLAQPLLDGFYAEGDLIVGDNQPYLGSLRGDCLWQHSTERGLASAIIEYRQDLVRDEAGQNAWADRTERIVLKTLSCENRGPPLRRIEHHGSLSDTYRRGVARLINLHRKPETRP
jgi:predicted N-formylglutamate amidohydrolase